MDHSKILEFYEDYSNKKFPFFETLDSKKCFEIRKGLSKNIDVFLDFEHPVEFTSQLFEKLSFYSNEDIDLQAIKFSKLLMEIGIENLPEKVNINWYNFDLIDQMRIADLDNYLSDLWYPNEDIEIFSTSFDWLVSLHHDSTIKFFIKN